MFISKTVWEKRLTKCNETIAYFLIIYKELGPTI